MSKTNLSAEKQDFPGNLHEMATLVFTETSLDDILDIAVRLGNATLDSAEGVSVTLAREGRMTTAAYTDDRTRVLDYAQYDSRDGPCLDALKESIEITTSLAADERWPEFSAKAESEGIHGVLSMPIKAGSRTVGSLNIYSEKASKFSSDQVDLGRLFAEQASTVIANAQAYFDTAETNTQLKQALLTREIIGQAKGILMEREKVGSDEAFSMLRKASQHTNTKLRDIAQQIVDSVDEPNGGSEG